MTRITFTKQNLFIALILVSALAAISAPGAMAGSVILSGTVSASCEAVITGFGTFSTLDLDIDSTDLKVAEVVETCNDADGYTISMQTANGTTGGQLNHSGGSSAGTIAYSIKYGVAASEAAVAFAASESTNIADGTKTPSSGVAKVILISHTALSDFPNPGIYSDTITITLTGK